MKIRERNRDKREREEKDKRKKMKEEEERDTETRVKYYFSKQGFSVMREGEKGKEKAEGKEKENERCAIKRKEKGDRRLTSWKQRAELL